ncbi:MAG: protein phosphatase CheZ [candidate division Zixibacteria bacterium]|jgi:chemotaxis regulatin CheY-phosphate phosphatase CheZ|nr:protein phosphatase CheZ [candidate division Zixibacteria bacterium]
MSGPETLQAKIQREISELSEAVIKVVDSFRQVKNPLVESQEKVPMATDQLDKISEQTEAAAHQMLDRVERITQREEEIIAGLGEIRKGVDGGSHEQVVGVIDAIRSKAETNLNDAYMIMDALQFQDITAQQMNHAASLLEDIEEKLKRIVAALNGQGAEIGDDQGDVREKRLRVFDPHADFADKRTEQEDIDSLFEREKKRR